MKLKIDINNVAKSPAKKVFVKKVILMTLEKSGHMELAEKSLGLSLAWVDEVEMQKINKLYCKKNKATDVLSFCEYKDASELKKAVGRELFLGELVLCYNYIQESVAGCVSETDSQKELARVIAHGVLHLLGFSHGKKMFVIQDMIANNF